MPHELEEPIPEAVMVIRDDENLPWPASTEPAAPGTWSTTDIESLQTGTEMTYLHMSAQVIRILASGVSSFGRPYKVIEAQYQPSATVTSAIAVGEKIGLLRLAHHPSVL